MLFPYFVYIAHFTKFTRGSSLVLEKSLLMEKSTAEESPWEKKRKKRQAQRRKSTTLSSKEQNSFVKAISTDGAFRWRPDFEQRCRRLTKICHT